MKQQKQKHTFCAILPSLSSSASRRMSSRSFSRCLRVTLLEAGMPGTSSLSAGVHERWISSNRWSSCSLLKSQASFVSSSCTFFTIASCFPARSHSSTSTCNFPYLHTSHCVVSLQLYRTLLVSLNYYSLLII